MGFFDTLFAPFSSSNNDAARNATRTGYRHADQSAQRYLGKGIGDLKQYYGNALNKLQGLGAYDPQNRYLGQMGRAGVQGLGAYQNALGLNGGQGYRAAVDQF